MSRPAKVVVNLSALRHNFNQARSLAPNSRIMAVIKADAYGHGLVPTAQALDSADAFGVACLEEAQELRQAKIKQRIVLLEGPYTISELPEISRLQLDIVVHDQSQLEMLEHTTLPASFSIWLKLDTGMHRLGFPPETAKQAYQRLKQCAAIADIRLMTHLASANNRADRMVFEQIDRFNQCSQALPGEKTIANSAGILACKQSHADWIRPGIMLYGVSPFIDSTGPDENLQPVMTFQSKLISVKKIGAGEPVGYGATWYCPEATYIGVVASGYGDGYPRHARSGTPILVNGKRAKLIGRASMDLLIVDLGVWTSAKVGDEIMLWGADLPVEEIAACAETIPYEILCSVHKRLKFEYAQE